MATALTIASDGTFTFTPTTNYNGPAGFAYTLSDADGATDTASVVVTINQVNDNPAAGDDTFTTDEDVVLTGNVTANDSDLDGDSISVSAVTNGDGSAIALDTDTTLVDGSGNTLGTLNIAATGAFTFTPAANYNGPASFGYTLSDGNGGSDTATASITVNPVNDNPAAADDTFTTDEDVVLTGNVTANDSDLDGDSISVSAVTNGDGSAIALDTDTTLVDGSGNTLGTLNIAATGAFTFTPAANYNGPASFGYTLSDGNDGTDTATASITVNPVNDAPQVQDPATPGVEAPDAAVPNQTHTDSEGLPGINFGQYFFDPDTGDALTFTVTGLPTGLSADTAGVVSGLIDSSASQGGPASNGIWPVTITANDGNGGTKAVTIQWTVINLPPVATIDSFTTDEDVVLTGSVIANDADLDGDSISVSAVINGDGSAIALDTDTTLVDGSGNTLGTLNIAATGAFTFSPAANYNGPAGFAYTLSDVDGATDTASVSIVVNPVNDPPVAADDTFTTDDNVALTGNVTANDSDLDGDSIIVSEVTNGVQTLVILPNVPAIIPGDTGGMFTLSADGSYTFEPGDDFRHLKVGESQATRVTYTLNGTTGPEGRATLTITVTGVNEAPVGVSPFASVSSVDPNNPPAGTPIGQELEAITPIDGGSMFTDIDNDVLTYSLGSGTPSWVNVNSVTGQITGTPPIDASAGGLSGNGVHTIVLIASDGNGGFATIEIPLVVEVPVPANPGGSSDQTGGDNADFSTGENISGGSQSSDTSFSGTTGGIGGNTGSASALSGGIGSDGQGPGQVGEFLASGNGSLSGSWSPPSESEQNTQYQPSFGGNDGSSAFVGSGSPFGSGNSLDGIANSLGNDVGLGSFGLLDPVSNPDTLNDQINFDQVSNSPTASATQKFRASPDILKAGSFTDIDIGDFVNTFRFEVSFTATEIYLHLLSLKEQLQYEINDWKLGFKKAEIDSKLLRKIDSKLYGVNRSITSETTELVTTISLKNGQTVTLTFVINTTTGEISNIKTVKTGSNAYETYTPDPSSVDATREYLAQDIKERPTDKLLRALRLA